MHEANISLVQALVMGILGCYPSGLSYEPLTRAMTLNVHGEGIACLERRPTHHGQESDHPFPPARGKAGMGGEDRRRSPPHLNPPPRRGEENGEGRTSAAPKALGNLILEFQSLYEIQ